MMKNEFCTGEFEKDCLAVFEKLLQGYNRAKLTSAWESEINTLVDKLTHLPTSPFHRELIELFDYHYLVLSEPIEEIIKQALELREQMQHTQRYVTIKEKYFSIPFVPKNTHLKSLEVFNHEGELCYQQTGEIKYSYIQFLKWILPWYKSVRIHDVIFFKQHVTQHKDLEIYYYSPLVDLSSADPHDYYQFFCDYYGKTQFLNYFKTKVRDIPAQITGQFYMSGRVNTVLSLSSSQQVLWAYFVFRLLGLKLRLNLEASMLTKFLLLMNKAEINDYKNSYYYKLFMKAPYIKEGKNLIVELEKTRMLFKEGNLPTEDIEEVIAKLLIE
nr:hypothetical protein [uncultured Carboxylicivirga sp.]